MQTKIHYRVYYFLVSSIIVFSLLFYFFDIDFFKIDDSFLTIATFVFSIFLGFFISKQTTRLEQISENLSIYDGSIVSIHQGLRDLDIGIEEKSGRIISTYYKTSIIGKNWDNIFKNHDHLISELRGLVRDISVPPERISEKTSVIFDNIYDAIDECENVRRKVISLRGQRIPQTQWIIVYLLLVVTGSVIVLSLNSHTSFFLSIVKSFFITAILFSVVLLKKLDDLTFFNTTLAEESAKDVLHTVQYSNRESK